MPNSRNGHISITGVSKYFGRLKRLMTYRWKSNPAR